LEAPKLAQIFREMGHEVFSCAGELDAANTPGRTVPEMHFEHPTARALHNEAFGNLMPPPTLFRRIYEFADHLRIELQAFIEDFGIDLIVSENASAIPMNISLGIAIADLVRRSRIKTLAHHHDFYWERTRFVDNNIQDVLNEAFPPDLAPIRHLVISTPIQRRLHSWRGINSVYLPNVFNFEQPPPPPDDYAMSFRKALGLSDDDLIVLQPTRVIRRKLIEKALELLRKLNDPRLILLITGYEGDEPSGYGAWLREEAERSGIRYRFIADFVGSSRDERDGKKVFTLWDIYPHAHLITYPSDYEGFGNALIEAIYFRKPLVVHTYPVYLADIKSQGVRAAEYQYDITPELVTSVRHIIDDASLREQMTAHNYDVGLRHFSYGVLRKTLRQALESFSES
jgi:mannosylglucosylglycerate synthase